MGKAIYPCQKCGASFAKAKSLRNHQRRRHQAFNCPACSYSFVAPMAVAEHYGTTHLVNSLHPCVWCAAVFTKPSTLRIHWQQAHNTTDPMMHDALPTTGTGTGRQTPLPDTAQPTAASSSSSTVPRVPTQTSRIFGSAALSAAGIPDFDDIHDTAASGAGDATPAPSDYEEHALSGRASSGGGGRQMDADLPSDVEGGGYLGGGETMLDFDQESSTRGSLPVFNTAGHANGGNRPTTPTDDVRVRSMVGASVPPPAAAHPTSSAAQNSPPSEVASSIFTCRICTKSPTEPIVPDCGHIFCRRCLIPEVSKTLSCPACHRSIFIRLQY